MDSAKIFSTLKSVLKNYESSLALIHNQSDNYYLNTAPTDNNKKGEFFAAVQIKKTYVSFHLMPVYYHPELLEKISEELRNKMQGKSCFNFKEINEVLFNELAMLTKRSFAKYKSLKKI